MRWTCGNEHVPGMSRSPVPFRGFVRHTHLTPPIFNQTFLVQKGDITSNFINLESKYEGNYFFCTLWGSHPIFAGSFDVFGLEFAINSLRWKSHTIATIGIPRCRFDLLKFPPNHGGMITVVRCSPCCPAMIHDPRQFQRYCCHQVEKRKVVIVFEFGFN